MLPSEQENVEELEKQFGIHFKAAQEWLGLSIEAYERFRSTIRPPKPIRSRNIVAAVFVQCVRRFRCVIALCRLGYEHEADILLRSCFETHLALRYMVKPLRKKRTCSPDLKAVLAKLPKIPNGHSVGDFRALLYAASGPIKYNELGIRASQLKGSKRVLPKAARERMVATISDIESLIGRDWLERLRVTKSYSGIRQIALLAEYCGQSKYYKLLYGPQSSHAHGEGATVMLSGLDAANIGDKVKLGGVLLGTCMDDMNKRFRLNLNDELKAMTVILALLK